MLRVRLHFHIFGNMPRLHLLIWLPFVLLSACKGGKSAPSPVVTEQCQALDTLFSKLEEMEAALLDGREWEQCKPMLMDGLIALEENHELGDSLCNYLDQRHHPDVPRLLWVESLRSRIEEDTISEGIYFLLRFRAVFKDDNEISEFFSEELASIALNNPQCYLGYLLKNPDQEVMLLYSTKWNKLDLPRQSLAFGTLEGGGVVADFLKNKLTQPIDEDI
jgi:hypothetical protein